MITKDNVKAVFDSFDEDDVVLMMENTSTDYFHIYITGNHGWVIVEEFHDHLNDEELSCGGFIADRDQILQMFIESESTNKFLKEWI